MQDFVFVSSLVTKKKKQEFIWTGGSTFFLRLGEVSKISKQTRPTGAEMEQVAQARC